MPIPVAALGRLLSLVACCIALADAASAQNVYTLSGRFGRVSGSSIAIPSVGSVSCYGHVVGKGVYHMVPDPTTPTTLMMLPANPGGCIPGGSAPVSTTGSGVGGAFTFPAGFFSQAAGMIGPHVRPVPTVPGILQLATHFSFAGPPATRTAPPAGTMNTGANTAAFRLFRADAWSTQTGRAGPDFTWCFGNPTCTRVTQASTQSGISHPLIVKYIAGPNRFGGTMSLLVGNGSFPSDIAFVSILDRVLFNTLQASGSQPTGRGYADTQPIQLGGGEFWGAYTLTMAGRIGMVSSYLGMGPGAYGTNFGFPFTTGTVIARHTGMTLDGASLVRTLTARGFDSISMAGARNLSLVAGAVAHVGGFEYSTITQMSLQLPEPDRVGQLLAGASLLLGIAVFRARHAPRRS